MQGLYTPRTRYKHHNIQTADPETGKIGSTRAGYTAEDVTIPDISINILHSPPRIQALPIPTLDPHLGGRADTILGAHNDVFLALVVAIFPRQDHRLRALRVCGRGDAPAVELVVPASAGDVGAVVGGERVAGVGAGLRVQDVASAVAGFADGGVEGAAGGVEAADAAEEGREGWDAGC